MATTAEKRTDTISPTRSKSRTSEKVFNSQPHQTCEGDIPILQSLEIGEESLLQLPTEFLNKIQTLRCVLESDLLACDAKWTLFVAVALSYRYDSKLVPFPPRFFEEHLGYNIDALVSVINDTPTLKVILQNIIERNFEELDGEVMDLLHWVLITLREPSLRAIDTGEFSIVLKTMDINEIPRQPTHVFEVNAPEGCHSDVEFLNQISDLPVKLGFCGHTLDSYFSLLHNGFGGNKPSEPQLLSTDLLTSLQKSPKGAAWGASQCGSLISCTALCEFAYDAAKDKITPNRSSNSSIDIELADTTRLRLRYLLFYGRRFPHERKPHTRGLMAWIYRHKYGLSLAMYLVLLATVGVANSGSGHEIKMYLSNKLEQFLEFCKNMIAME